MPKTYDEKRDAFQRMLEGRLPKAVKAVELLANLARGSDYAWTNAELQGMTDQLDDAVDTVLSAFGIETAKADDYVQAAGEVTIDIVADNPFNEADTDADVYELRMNGMPEDAAMCEADSDKLTVNVRSEVKWSYDALKRGDKKLAEDRLRRAVEAIIAEERDNG